MDLRRPTQSAVDAFALGSQATVPTDVERWFGDPRQRGPRTGTRLLTLRGAELPARFRVTAVLAVAVFLEASWAKSSEDVIGQRRRVAAARLRLS